MKIELYKPQDKEAVWELHKLTVATNEGFVKNLAYHTDLQDIPGKYSAFFVIRDGLRIVGMVGIKGLDDGSGEVKRLEVHPEYQGQGLGRQLMEAAIKYAQSHAMLLLHLDASKTQARAIDLYKSLGFKQTREERLAYGPDNQEFDMVFMTKMV